QRAGGEFEDDARQGKAAEPASIEFVVEVVTEEKSIGEGEGRRLDGEPEQRLPPRPDAKEACGEHREEQIDKPLAADRPGGKIPMDIVGDSPGMDEQQVVDEIDGAEILGLMRRHA